MRSIVPLVLIAAAGQAVAADGFVVRSGPFEVYSLAGDKSAKDIMNFAEQLRYTLGWQLGNQDLQTTWPVRMLVVKKKQSIQPECRLARDAFVCGIAEPGPELASSLTKILLDSWVGHLPPPFERGLIQVYSTVEIAGAKVTLGAVPPQTDRDWVRAHMLSVDPSFSGKLRVMLGNLSKGVEPEVAYKNAFGLGPEDLERAVDRYMEARNYGTITAPSRPLNAQKQFIAKELSAGEIQVLQADLTLAAGSPAAKSTFESLLRSNPNSPEAHEALGYIALQAGDRSEAQKQLAQGRSARALVEYAKLLDDREAKRATLTKAAAANLRWSEPQRLLAAVETNPVQELAALKKATQLEPQNPDLWIELAQLQEANKQFPEATKSWASAERATGDPEARERVRSSRLGGERKRLEADIAAKEEARRQAQAEMEALRNRALMNIRQAEARANAGKPVLDPSKLDVYREGPETKTIRGVLQRVDCLGQQARLHIASGRQGIILLVPDPGKLGVSGGGQSSLACGLQKPARNVNVEYTPRAGSGKGIAGDAVTVEFR